MKLSAFFTIFLIIAVLPNTSAQGDNQDLFDQINTLRSDRRLPPLQYTNEYQVSCDNWAKYISEHYGHSFYNRTWHEEIVSIVPIREVIIPAFIDSKPHKKALMSRAVTRVCIGTYQAGPGEPVHTCIRTYR